jgi:flavorubredoxin
MMQTQIDEIGDRIFRLSTFVPEIAPPDGFSICQFLIDADEPLLYHCGPRAMFASVSAAAATVIPLARLRWISFGHVESDECGAMNAWLAAAPAAQVVYTALGCDVSVADMADRPPKTMADGEVLDIGGRRIRFLETPHVPHGWEAQAIHEETTATLFCGDLLGHVGNGPALTRDDVLAAAIATEALFRPTSLGPVTAPTIRRLAELQPRTLALMHGSSFSGDGGALLHALADHFDCQLRDAVAARPGVSA